MRRTHKMESFIIPSIEITKHVYYNIRYNIQYHIQYFFLLFWLKNSSYIILIKKKKILRSNYIFYYCILVFSNQSRFFPSKPRAQECLNSVSRIPCCGRTMFGTMAVLIHFFLLSLSTKAIVPLERINSYNLNNVS